MPTGRRRTSWLFTSVGKDFSSGLLRDFDLFGRRFVGPQPTTRHPASLEKKRPLVPRVHEQSSCDKFITKRKILSKMREYKKQ